MRLKYSCSPHFLAVALQGTNIATLGETYKRSTKMVKGLWNKRFHQGLRKYGIRRGNIITE